MTNLLSEAELRLLFWDTDYTQIDFKKHSKAVIERILMFGSMDAYRWLFRFYEINDIKKVITTSRQLFHLSKHNETRKAFSRYYFIYRFAKYYTFFFLLSSET